MTTPSERFHDLMGSFGPEERARVKKKIEELASSRDDVAWREDPDPFGQDWGWLDAPTSQAQLERSPRVAPSTSTLPWRRRAIWAAGVAASTAAVAIGTWVAFPGRRPIREQQMVAWVAHRLVPGPGGLTISAAPEDGDADRSPITTGADRPVDAKPPGQPNVYAPIRVQEQLVVPLVSAAGEKGFVRPFPTVTERVRPGSLFYLEFSTAGVTGGGTAVAVRVSPTPVQLYAQETSFGPGEGTSYIGPLKMDEVESEFFVIVADGRNEPLTNQIAAVLAVGQLARDDTQGWRSRLATSLTDAGHEWYGVQRIIVKPDVVEAKPR